MKIDIVTTRGKYQFVPCPCDNACDYLEYCVTNKKTCRVMVHWEKYGKTLVYPPKSPNRGLPVPRNPDRDVGSDSTAVCNTQWYSDGVYKQKWEKRGKVYEGKFWWASFKNSSGERVRKSTRTTSREEAIALRNKWISEERLITGGNL